MPSTIGGVSLFRTLQFGVPPLLFKFASLVGRFNAERGPPQVVDSVLARTFCENHDVGEIAERNGDPLLAFSLLAPPKNRPRWSQQS